MKEQMLQTEGFLKKIWNKVRHGHSGGSLATRNSASAARLSTEIEAGRAASAAKRNKAADDEAFHTRTQASDRAEQERINPSAAKKAGRESDPHYVHAQERRAALEKKGTHKPSNRGGFYG